MESNFKTWEKIRKEYETTKTSYVKLSKKYGFHEKTVQARSKKGGWIKFSKGIEIAIKKGRDIFLEDTSTGIKELMKKEDETLAKFQEVVDGKVPYERIFKSLEFAGKLTVKIDGTVKGLVETTMMIGNKRRELRGVLPLKERQLIDIKKEELRHKKEMDKSKLEIDKAKAVVELDQQKLELQSKQIDYENKKELNTIIKGNQ
ncbi:MAG: hypothetical protein WBG30_08795 [Psychrilyobacter sp.]|uniref:hypothetical protein n=1 Tax=Psychrilyobacter sp. TaxID=2586924 RepID=UPI003C7803F2